ncbi:hypothetical protein C8Q80DRAFT_177138 [Daedaleopsis nitida]|nr:hypothetical protein C8Q80DRAFT_177138 [Daedaleopsis nitida]
MIDDPYVIAVAGGDPSLIPLLGRVMIRSVALVPGAGHLYTARDYNGALVGFALFELPGYLMCTTEAQRAVSGIDGLIEQLPPEGKAFYSHILGHVKTNDEMFGIEEAERTTYWCTLAMVREDYQGHGIGKAMFQLAFQQAAAMDVRVALVTTNIRNVPIYTKIGFTCHGERKVSSPWLCCTKWFFSMDPNSEHMS